MQTKVWGRGGVGLGACLKQVEEPVRALGFLPPRVSLSAAGPGETLVGPAAFGLLFPVSFLLSGRAVLTGKY